MKNALIFGITGQDGSYLTELLLSKGYNVTGVARRTSTPNLSRLTHLLHQINIVEGDITDAFNVNNIVNDTKPDEIYNLAAQSHVATSFEQPSLTLKVTAGGCLNILEAIRFSGRKDKIKFYQASSSEMFGKNYDQLYDEYDGPGTKYQDEETEFMPQSPYAIAKLAAHHLVRNYRDSYGIFACSGILFNHESERRGENFVTRKITRWIGQYIEWKNGHNEEFKYSFDTNPDNIVSIRNNDFIFGPSFPKLRLGNLDAKRDWGHAEDYVEAMWLMLQAKNPDDYVVATGETHSVREFLEVAFDMVQIANWQDYIVQDPKFYRASEVDYLLGRSFKAQKELKWKPKISFKNLVQRMVSNDINVSRL